MKGDGRSIVVTIDLDGLQRLRRAEQELSRRARGGEKVLRGLLWS